MAILALKEGYHQNHHHHDDVSGPFLSPHKNPDILFFLYPVGWYLITTSTNLNLSLLLIFCTHLLLLLCCWFL